MSSGWSSPPRDTEIAIVGGGIAGLSSALFLARGGAEVTVLERAEAWSEASGANAGTLSLQVKILPVLTLARRALDLWEQLSGMGIDTGFARPGGLRVATSNAQAAELRRYAEQQALLGVKTDWIEGPALAAFAPWLGASVRAATYCTEDGYASPLLTGPSLVEAVRGVGARLAARSPVTAIERRGDGYRLTVPAGEIACCSLVLAAGPRTTELGRMLGARLPLYVDVNMLSVTEQAPPLIDRVVTHIGGVLSLKQHRNGTILIGGGWQGQGGYASGRRELDHERLMQNLKQAAAVVPALARLRLVRSWAGFEAVTPDALPLLGRLPGHRNAYVSAGARGGFRLGLVQGQLLAELLRQDRTSLPIEAFDPARYGDARPVAGAVST
jgi:glycine/D-amino acid oxidase-like deaminating enzyme